MVWQDHNRWAVCRHYCGAGAPLNHSERPPLFDHNGCYETEVMVAAVMASNETGLFCNHAFYSDDWEKIWQMSDMAFGGDGRSGDEAKLVELRDGRIPTAPSESISKSRPPAPSSGSSTSHLTGC